MPNTINIGEQVNINMSTGVDADYTFSSSSPACATVSSIGVVSGVSAGSTAITIIRNSDGALVGRILIQVEADAPVEPLPTIDVIPVVYNGTLTIDDTTPGVIFFTWSGIDVSTPLGGNDYYAGLVNSRSQPGYGIGGLLGASGSGHFATHQWQTNNQGWESGTTYFDFFGHYVLGGTPGEGVPESFGSPQATAQATVSTTPPITNILATQGVGQTMDVTFDTSSGTERTYYVLLGTSGFETDVSFSFTDSGTSHTVNVPMTNPLDGAGPSGNYNVAIGYAPINVAPFYALSNDPQNPGYPANSTFAYTA
jgi:hypothetical protein